NLLTTPEAEWKQSQSREGNSVTERARDNDSKVLAREARFDVGGRATGRIRCGEPDVAYAKTIRLTFPLRISRRHGVGRGLGVTHPGRGCVSTDPTSIRPPNTR